MKKVIIIAAALLCGVCANARGFVGGAFSVSGNGGTTSFAILPEVGIELSQASTVALKLGYGKVGDAKGTFQIEPYYRLTCAQLGEKVDFFVDGAVPMAFGDQVSQFGIQLRPGLAFHASEKIALVAAVGAFGFATTTSGGEKSTNWGIGVNGNAIQLGVYYKF